ncbi:MAG: hypothetical protein QOD86_1109 [Miltoncostaeaceae bacterium]|jgi:uncharacterized membrane protein YeaQ/YmgE (transglycosylase-associated protein family)|nr:hypothetical protein [Miltoncostaeaceae bacterium]
MSARGGKNSGVLAVLIIALAVIVLIAIGAAVVGFAIQLLWWALIGLAIGALARLVLPGTQAIGLLRTALIGAAGALLGGILADALDAGDFLKFVMAILIAAILVLLLGGAGKKSRSRAPARVR